MTTSALTALAAVALCATCATAASASQSRSRKLQIPVFGAQLWPSLTSYRSYARAELGDVSTELQTLLAAEQSGDLAASQAAWLPAHLSWLDIGQDDGAYGAFGALGREIDGTAAGYVKGTASSSFTGFHRVEFDLWERGDVTAAVTDTEKLQTLIAKLQAKGMAKELPKTANAIQTWVLRAHEILEDADRDTLTGSDDYGSGTGVASVVADAAATRKMLSLLKVVIHPRAPKLVSRCDGDLDRILRVADATKVNGAWIGVSELPLASREKLDAAVGTALENLAPISDIIHISGSTI